MPIIDTESDLAASFRNRGRNPEQLHIAGTRSPNLSAVDEAAERLREAECALKAAKEIKDTSGDLLIETMRENEIDIYKYTDSEGVRWTVRIGRKTKVTIKRTGADD